ncbi:hypothetical protein T440DRAFT_506722 [Plenodomus tracheiphilus IPT5]|uniref:Uncharacterized protein n=1 Tax=Plenodomus tracheiphilus IPT5 TaxID=1408161 RepID=A0A6A7BC60_9PLEO|nr:hypothetical protein T440DRAFT_506722 [Plenodomus tracheiphilus IPT5]
MASSQWVFPPPTLTPTFFNTTLLPTNLAIYLNASTSSWPSTGFGRTPTYNHDALALEWPSTTTTPQTLNWHCLPCRQLSSSLNETANWEACTYPTADTLPDLLTSHSPSPPKATTTITHGPSILPPLYQEKREQQISSYYITLPFRFTNADRYRVTGETSYVFNASVPEGVVDTEFRYDDDNDGRWTWSTEGVVGVVFVMVALVVGVGVGVAYGLRQRRRMQKKALEALAAKEGGGGDVGAVENGGVGGGKEGKSELRMEREAEEGLPGYEGPPGYAEATSDAASSRAGEAGGVAR